MKFEDWTPLRFVNYDLLSRVRLAYVFGKTGQEAFMITEDDEVFACGPNYSHCLGLEKEGPQIEPIKVTELCHKKVKGDNSMIRLIYEYDYCNKIIEDYNEAKKIFERFSHSVLNDGAFICAYTSDKRLYFWGKYLTRFTLYKTPTLSSMKEFDTTVLEVVSGPSHCLILTFDGKIFSFGYNNRGQLGRSNSDNGTPSLIGDDLRGKMVTKVSCGACFSVAVLDNGEVYAWGKNDDGQLGVENEIQDLKLPHKISALTNIVIENIACGASYILAISDNGDLYSWGKNDVGQLGLGDTTSRSEPVKVEKIGKVIDVAATAYGSTTAAMSETNEVYMWGACGAINLTEPTKTLVDTVFDVFAFIANPRIMPRPMSRSLRLDFITKSIRNAFENSETSDLTIVADEKEIFVHKIILTLRSDYFKVLLQKSWLGEDKNVLIINQNYDGIHAYLEYLYTGNFRGTPEIALESLKIAHEYHDLAWKEICENHVKHGITVENFADIYDLALKLEAKGLAKYCVLFAAKHIGDIICTPGFFKWDPKTYQRFIGDCHKQKLFKY